jgi:gliding motility-associatede transport system auxiliary component
MKLDRVLAVAAGVAGLVVLLTAAFLGYVQLGPNPRYLVIPGIALLIAAAILDPTLVLGVARTRRGRTGAMSFAFSAVVLAALFLLNVIAGRGLQHVDLSASQLHTLTPKSVAVVRQLRSDLDVTVFAAPNDPNRSTLQSLFALYQDAGPHVKVRYVDPRSDVAEAQSLGVTSAGSAVLRYQDRKPVVLAPGSQSEQDVTGGILKLELNHELTVCWASGDGERDPTSTDATFGYSQAGQAMGGEDFVPRQLVLSEATSVPPDCAVVAVVGPTQPLSSSGSAALKSYLAGGGRLLLAVDPWRPDVAASFNALVQPIGLKFDGALVAEDSAHTYFGHPDIPVVVSYGSSPIAKDLRNVASFFPDTTSISGPESPVASSSTGSYAVAQPRQDPARQPGDKPGPFDLMASYEQATSGGGRERVVMVGTSGLAENLVVPPTIASANLELFLSSLDWLSGQDALVSLPAKPQGSLPLALTGAQADLDVALTLIVLPVLIGFGGFAVWLYRRRTA